MDGLSGSLDSSQVSRTLLCTEKTILDDLMMALLIIWAENGCLDVTSDAPAIESEVEMKLGYNQGNGLDH